MRLTIVFHHLLDASVVVFVGMLLLTILPQWGHAYAQRRPFLKINAPLHWRPNISSTTRWSAKMKRGAYLVNTPRGKICDRDAVVRTL
jgi:hypothetical protein